MKTIYIPKGETVCYDNLATERIVVKGCLRVSGSIHVKSIVGGGVVYADSVQADGVRVDNLKAGSVICQRLIAKDVQTPRLIASESAAVSRYLDAAYVTAGKLTVAASRIGEVEAEEVVNLPLKKRSLFGLLLASALHSFWAALTDACKNDVIDAEFVPAASREESDSAHAA